MYQYDEYDRRIVTERAQQFRGQVERRLSGEITEEEFKPLRLQNGLYMQLHAYMLRVAIPYGLLSSTQVRKLAHIARTYDRGYGHLTTRQNVQYNWPKLADVPAILDELASVEMHAVQTSGNCVRNITSDHFAGVARDELEDPRPVLRDPAPVVDVPPRVRVPAAQVQDRGDRHARRRSRGGAVPRHRRAHRRERGRRARLRGARRRRPRPHAA